jgi:hypothetical protein
MERIGVLRTRNANLVNFERTVKEFFDVKGEDLDMRQFINRFKERDFKLRRLFDIVSGGWSFSNSDVFFKDGRNIF